MKTMALCFAAALATAACSTPRPPADPPVRAAEVAPPRCGVLPKIPPSVATRPDFTRATVVVGFMLAPSGEVSAVRVVNASGFATLDNAVLAQVQQWRCPSTSRRTAAMPAELALEFKLEQTEQSDVGRR